MFTIIGDEIWFDGEKVATLVPKLRATLRAKMKARLYEDLPEPEEKPEPRTDRAAGGYYYERKGGTPNPQCNFYAANGSWLGVLQSMPVAQEVVSKLNSVAA
jgi:hypothetical protein